MNAGVISNQSIVRFGTTIQQWTLALRSFVRTTSSSLPSSIHPCSWLRMGNRMATNAVSHSAPHNILPLLRSAHGTAPHCTPHVWMISGKCARLVGNHRHAPREAHLSKQYTHAHKHTPARTHHESTATTQAHREPPSQPLHSRVSVCVR